MKFKFKNKSQGLKFKHSQSGIRANVELYVIHSYYLINLLSELGIPKMSRTVRNSQRNAR